MKLFHLSDLHIGKQLHHYNLAAEQRKTLAQIVALAKSEHPDAILIAGDIYDTPVPSAEAVSVFDAFLSALCEIEPQMTVPEELILPAVFLQSMRCISRDFRRCRRGRRSAA